MLFFQSQEYQHEQSFTFRFEVCTKNYHQIGWNKNQIQHHLDIPNEQSALSGVFTMAQ